MILEVCSAGLWKLSFGLSQFHGHGAWLVCEAEPYIGCSYPYPPIPMGFGWAWVRCYCSWVGIGFVHPCIQLQIRVKLLGCREYANQEALRAEAIDNEGPFIYLIQSRLDVGG
jgi:hypothetical protein